MKNQTWISAGEAFNKGRFDEAVGLYRNFLELSPREATAHYNLASSLMHYGDVDEARVEFGIALALGYYHPDLFLNLGICQASLGEVKNAMLTFTFGLDISPDHVSLLNAICSYATSAGMYEKALLSATRILNLSKAIVGSEVNGAYRRLLANALDTVANLYLTLGRAQEAETIYKNGVAFDASLVERSDYLVVKGGGKFAWRKYAGPAAIEG